jgi:hypothetical protein
MISCDREGGGGNLLLAGNFFSEIVKCKLFFSVPTPCTIFFCHSLFRSIFFQYLILFRFFNYIVNVVLSVLASCIAWPLLRQGRRKLFSIGGGGSLKCHFLDFGGKFDRILMVRKQRFSMLKFTI